MACFTDIIVRPSWTCCDTVLEKSRNSRSTGRSIVPERRRTRLRPPRMRATVPGKSCRPERDGSLRETGDDVRLGEGQQDIVPVVDGCGCSADCRPLSMASSVAPVLPCTESNSNMPQRHYQFPLFCNFPPASYVPVVLGQRLGKCVATCTIGNKIGSFVCRGLSAAAIAARPGLAIGPGGRPLLR